MADPRNNSECQSVSRTLSRRRADLRRPKNITDAAHGMNQLNRKVSIDVIAQAANEHINQVGWRDELVVPQSIDQLILGQRPSCVADQQFEQGKLARGE